jgi:hypothetical protein
VAGRNRSIEKFSDLGNRTRELPVCSIVPQSTTLFPVAICIRIYVFVCLLLLLFFFAAHYATMLRFTASDIEGGTTLISYRNTVNTEIRIAVARKAQQFPRISTHLMMVE